MNHGLRLSQAGIADASAIAALDSLIFGLTASNQNSWRDEIANSAGTVIVAARAGENVGFISFLRAADDVEILKIGVRAEFRRQGIAKDLLGAALANHPARCLIDVSATNAQAVAFYREMGFHEVRRRYNYYADGSDAIVMVRSAS